MKIRTDFVTNSSSSSFILGFNTEEEIDDILNQLPYYWSEEVKKNIVSDIKNEVISKESAIQYYMDRTWFGDGFRGKSYWSLTKEEKKSAEFQNYIQNQKSKLAAEVAAKLNNYKVISIVTYGDDDRLGSELEHEIMPYLDSVIERMSNH